MSRCCDRQDIWIRPRGRQVFSDSSRTREGDVTLPRLSSSMWVSRGCPSWSKSATVQRIGPVRVLAITISLETRTRDMRPGRHDGTSSRDCQSARTDEVGLDLEQVPCDLSFVDLRMSESEAHSGSQIYRHRPRHKRMKNSGADLLDPVSKVGSATSAKLDSGVERHRENGCS